MLPEKIWLWSAQGVGLDGGKRHWREAGGVEGMFMVAEDIRRQRAGMLGGSRRAVDAILSGRPESVSLSNSRRCRRDAWSAPGEPTFVAGRGIHSAQHETVSDCLGPRALAHVDEHDQKGVRRRHVPRVGLAAVQMKRPDHAGLDLAVVVDLANADVAETL